MCSPVTSLPQFKRGHFRIGQRGHYCLGLTGLSPLFVAAGTLGVYCPAFPRPTDAELAAPLPARRAPLATMVQCTWTRPISPQNSNRSGIKPGNRPATLLPTAAAQPIALQLRPT